MQVHHNQPGIEKIAFDANMDEHLVNILVKKAPKLVSCWMVGAKLILQTGGRGQDVEADEISCPNAASNADDDGGKIQWTRSCRARKLPLITTGVNWTHASPMPRRVVEFSWE